MDAVTTQAIINRARDIIILANHIRDIFPDDLPHLWDSLSPNIDEIESQAHMIVRLAKGG